MNTSEEFSGANDLLEWVATVSLPGCTLAEQEYPYDNNPVSVNPLTRSHTAYFSTKCF